MKIIKQQKPKSRIRVKYKINDRTNDETKPASCMGAYAWENEE